ncbi:MAG: sigma-70 family RNA polymerase sigma factor, partial [Planctomycetales bacterium]
VKDNFSVLRHFKGTSSLATYLTVVARRVCVREMLRRKMGKSAPSQADVPEPSVDADQEERLTNREEVERLLQSLAGSDADVVRLYHLEGKSYQEISASLGIPENSIGPTLSRAREKMRAMTP